MNAVLAAARASRASDGPRDLDLLRVLRVRGRAEQLAHRLDAVLVDAHEDRRRGAVGVEQRLGDVEADQRRGVELRRERDRVEDADDGEPAPAEPHARAGVGDPQRVGRLGAEHDRRVAARSRR